MGLTVICGLGRPLLPACDCGNSRVPCEALAIDYDAAMGPRVHAALPGSAGWRAQLRCSLTVIPGPCLEDLLKNRKGLSTEGGAGVAIAGRTTSRIDLRQAVEAARRFAEQRFPRASLVLLCGSWARGCAHEDSDLDVIVLDSEMDAILFEGVHFESWLVEVCALPPDRIDAFFRGSSQYRSAPVPRQALDGILVVGDRAAATQLKDLAREVLEQGPHPMDEKEALDLRWNLTCLLADLAHVADDEVVALAAQCHSQLALAALDSARAWKAERKGLRRALVEIAPALGERLDDALRAAVQGNRLPLLQTGHEILEALGGSRRTYVERF